MTIPAGDRVVTNWEKHAGNDGAKPSDQPSSISRERYNTTLNMEHMLRCNSLKCRKELADKALVTTCSSPLTNPDDAVVTNLNPSEDYKTSVLSGLSPNVIIECTSRALSFWAYQTIQEVVYQEYLGKTLTEKYTNLTVHLDKVISEANTQITALNNKIANLSFDQQSLRRKNDELAQAFREKNKKLMQTQELYDRLKRKAMMGQMQHAAEDAVDLNLYSNTELGARGPGLDPARLSPGLYPEAGPMYRQARQQANTQGGNDMYSAQVSNQSNLGAWGKAAGGGAETHSPRHATNTRPPLNDMTGNIRNAGKFPAVGLSSGLKTSHNGGGYNGFAVPTTRPQAIQRPAPTTSSLGRAPGHRPESVLGDIRSASIMGGIPGGFTSR
ncbi:hypothetical protein SCAR479_12739 [Seiridium cardinale]|uniref:Uncharacterized protein n=1 Tax=Seiridium cardinale TaxID=138064 RepID=A0ABR2X9U8_9PEZI